MVSCSYWFHFFNGKTTGVQRTSCVKCVMGICHHGPPGIAIGGALMGQLCEFAGVIHTGGLGPTYSGRSLVGAVCLWFCFLTTRYQSLSRVAKLGRGRYSSKSCAYILSTCIACIVQWNPTITQRSCSILMCTDQQAIPTVMTEYSLDPAICFVTWYMVLKGGLCISGIEITLGLHGFLIFGQGSCLYVYTCYAVFFLWAVLHILLRCIAFLYWYLKL